MHAARILTEMLRGKYHIPASNCVTHAQVSVNPDNMLVGYHTDWAGNFPFLDIGLKRQLRRAACQHLRFRVRLRSRVCSRHRRSPLARPRVWPRTRCKRRPPRAAFPCPNTEPFFRRNTRRYMAALKAASAARRKSSCRHNDKANNSAVGLDVGTSRICLAQRVGEEFQYRNSAECFRHHSVFANDGERTRRRRRCRTPSADPRSWCTATNRTVSPTCSTSRPGAPWTKAC